MNIVIDATWVADRNYNGKITCGALRVLIELLAGLGDFPQHTFYLTCSSYLPEEHEKLIRFNTEIINCRNVKVSVVSFNGLKNKYFRNLYYKLSSYFPVSFFIPFIEKDVLKKTDIYHSCNDAIPRFIRNKKNIKKFFTALDLIPLVRPDFSNQFQDYTRKLYTSLPKDVRILAISQSTKKDVLFFRKDLKEEQIRVVYLGASKEFFYQLDAGFQLEDKLLKYGIKPKKYFLTVNAVAKYKNCEFVLDGFVDYNMKSKVKDTKMLVIGMNREKTYKDYLFNKYGDEKSIIFLENLLDEELTYLYNGAKAFLYMSKYEGFGLPVLEAMQCGTPVICSNSTSIPEIVGDAALNCDPTDSKTFKTYLEAISTDSNLETRLIESGLRQSLKFSWKKYQNDVVDAYSSL